VTSINKNHKPSKKVKNKPIQLTDHKAGLFYATSTEVSSQKSDEVSDS
jgi:hypothetical protein